MAIVRRLTPSGREAFRLWVEGGAAGEVPRALLTDPIASEPIQATAIVDDVIFPTRLACGRHLHDRLTEKVRMADLRFDGGLWDWLSLFYIEQLLPETGKGRGPGEIVRYCLELENRKWSRHLMRMNWLTVQQHGDNAKLILSTPMNQGTDLQEQLAGRQELFGSRGLFAAATALYWDDAKESPKRGHATRTKGGVVQRLGRVMRQFALTYDVEALKPDQVLDLLPFEFERWKPIKGRRVQPSTQPAVQA